MSCPGRAPEVPPPVIASPMGTSAVAPFNFDDQSPRMSLTPLTMLLSLMADVIFSNAL
jgi:hypothetical protein